MQNTTTEVMSFITAIGGVCAFILFILYKFKNLLTLIEDKSKRQKLILLLKVCVKGSQWLIKYLEDEKNKPEPKEQKMIDVIPESHEEHE